MRFRAVCVCALASAVAIGSLTTLLAARFGPTAPPVIAKAFDAATIPVGGVTGLTFTLTNPNGATALAGVAFTDTLPAGLVVATPNGLSTTCGSGTITAVAGSGTISLTGLALAASASCTISVNVSGTTKGLKNNSVTVSSTTAGTGNTATASLTVVAPPVLDKAFGAASIAVGGSTSLTFTLVNPNASTTLNGVAFTDTLPAGLIISSPNGLSTTCTGTVVATAGTASFSFSSGVLASGFVCTIAVSVTGTSPGSPVNTTSAVTSTEGSTGNSAFAPITITAAVPTLPWSVMFMLALALAGAGVLALRSSQTRGRRTLR